MADEIDTADALSAIGNHHRIEILRELMRADKAATGPVAYSELMERIGMRDSGKFNYHLQQLLGRFVAQSENGYRLTYAGRTVSSAIASGTLDDSIALDSKPVSGSCYECGEHTLVLQYPGERVRVTCTTCGEEIVHILFPPAAVRERTFSELERDFNRWAKRWHTIVSENICPECLAPINGELSQQKGTPATGNTKVRAAVSCDQCWVRGHMPPGFLVLTHPQVVTAYWKQGIDIRNEPIWELDWAITQEFLSTVTEDPLTVDVTIPVVHGEIVFRIGPTLTIESIEKQFA